MPTDTKEYSKDYVIEPTKQKQSVVDELTEKLGRSSGAVLLDYRGLSVTEMSDLRTRLGATDADFHVVKNTLLRIAAEANNQDFGNLLEGPSAIAILYGDPVAPTKVFSDYLREHRDVTLKGGMLDGRSLSAAQVEALSKIPPKEVLLAQLLAGMQGPISGFVGTLSGILSNFVFTLQAVADQKGGGGEASA